MTAAQLYAALVSLCQQYGITTAATYDHIHSAIESIVVSDDETVDEDGEFLPRGRCDTCGNPCDEQGCTLDRDHQVAIF